MKIVAVVLIVMVVLYFGYKKLNLTEEKEMSVKIEKTAKVSHGDHWGAMYGFSEDTEHKVNESFDELELQEVLSDNLALYHSSYGQIENIAIVKDRELLTLFPQLLTKKTLPITLKSIVEWTPTDGLEAHIKGSGRDTFGLGFFATDYAKNREIYKKGGTLEIALSAFAYVVEKGGISDSNESSEVLFAEDFCGYFPSQEIDDGYGFEFIGKLLSIETMNYRDEKFYIMEVKLINDNELEFILPMAVNVKNVRDEKIEVGDSISGVFWLQGRIL